jgi:hypothetical protein
VVIALQFLDLSENDQARLASSFAALAETVDADGVPRVWSGTKAPRPDA